MKPSGVDRTVPEAPGASPSRRRSLLVGAGVAGAAALAARVLPTAPAEAVADPAAKPAVDEQGGYRLTQHVLRYYETTKI
jgi:hypothetical protein